MQRAQQASPTTLDALKILPGRLLEERQKRLVKLVQDKELNDDDVGTLREREQWKDVMKPAAERGRERRTTRSGAGGRGGASARAIARVHPLAAQAT